MTDRATWEARYAAGAAAPPRPPAQLLIESRAVLPHGPALDVACGDGRNALYLARAGWPVDAIDRSHAALVTLAYRAQQEHLPVRGIEADLTDFPLPIGRYAVVVNVRYLQRSLLRPLADALSPGGVLVFETFLREQARLGHPRNPAFLLEPGELRAAFSDLEIITYSEGLCDDGGGPAWLARMVARRAPLD